MQTKFSKQIKKLFPNKLHSVYVYGSVARGDKTPYKSDLDLLALFVSELSLNQSIELKTLAKEFSQKYSSLVHDVGIAVAYYEYAIEPATGFWLKNF